MRARSLGERRRARIGLLALLRVRERIKLAESKRFVPDLPDGCWWYTEGVEAAWNDPFANQARWLFERGDDGLWTVKYVIGGGIPEARSRAVDLSAAHSFAVYESSKMQDRALDEYRGRRTTSIVGRNFGG